MPSLTLSGQEISPKRLQRATARSSKMVAFHSATFHGETLPRIRKLALALWRDAMQTSGEERVKLAREFANLTELRRQLLGFPSPGKRRDVLDVAASVKQASNAEPVDAVIVPEGEQRKET